MRTLAFQSTTKFLPCTRWFLGSLKFLTDQFGNLSLQEPELSEVVGSGSSRLPPALVPVGLINKAQLRLGPSGETDTNPMVDKADHTVAAQAAAIDPIYSPSLGPDSKYRREVYMVAQNGEVPEKTTEEL
jgi:hypothetical protein